MPLTPETAILCASNGTIEEALAYARSRHALRLDQVELYVKELFRLCRASGIRFEVAFAQWSDETGVGSDRIAWEGRLNPAGLGIEPDEDDNIGFDSGTEAARAHLVHLWYYAGGEELPPALAPFAHLDPRKEKVREAGFMGKARHLSFLSGRWATNLNYANQIVDHANLAFSGLEDCTEEVIPVPDPIPGQLRFGRVQPPPIVDKTIPNKQPVPGNGVLGYDLLGTRKGRIVGTCVHRMDGGLLGTFNSFSDDNFGALADYGVGGQFEIDHGRPELDGVIWKFNDPEGERTPWANGFNPDNGEHASDNADGIAFRRTFAGEETPWNRRLVSIETSGCLGSGFCGGVETPVTDKQVESIARLIAYWHDRIGVPWNVFPNHPGFAIRTQLVHECFTTKRCPGDKLKARLPEIRDRAQKIMRAAQTGSDGPFDPPAVDTDPLAIAGNDEGILSRWFGKVDAENGQHVAFTPRGRVPRLWGFGGAATGQYPTIEGVQVFPDNPQQTRRYFRFANGLTIFRTTNQDPWRLGLDGSATEGPFPKGMDAGLAARWFGTADAEDGDHIGFNAEHPLGKLWLAEGMKTGRYPALKEIQTIGNDPDRIRRYFRFAGGLTILKVSGEPWRVLRRREGEDGDGPFFPGFTRELAKRWFGRGTAEDGQVVVFDLDDPVTRLWLADGAKNGLFPAIDSVPVFGTAPQQRRYYRFANGLTILKAGSQAPRVLRV